MNRVDAAEAEDGVKVDQPAPLELANLGIGQLDHDAVGLGELVQLATESDDGASPEFGSAERAVTVAAAGLVRRGKA
jgi:hypothetical protein